MTIAEVMLRVCRPQTIVVYIELCIEAVHLIFICKFELYCDSVSMGRPFRVLGVVASGGVCKTVNYSSTSRWS